MATEKGQCRGKACLAPPSQSSTLLADDWTLATSRFSLPMAVKDQSEEDQGEAERRSDRLREPQVDCQRHGADHESSRDPWVAPAAVRSRQIWFAATHPKHRHHSQAVENPGSENEQRGKLLERAGEHH